MLAWVPACTGMTAHTLNGAQCASTGGDQDHAKDDVGVMNGRTPFEDGGEADVVHHALDDKHVHADGRMDQPELDRHDDDGFAELVKKIGRI